MNFEFISREQISDEEWDDFVESSPEGWVFALSGWQRLILAVEEWDLQEHSIGLQHCGQLIAVLPLQFQRNARRLASSGFGNTGPLLAPDLPKGLRSKALKTVFAHLFEVARSCNASTLQFGLSPLTATSINNNRGVTPYLEYGLTDISTVARVASLAVTEKDLWLNLSQNARQMVRRARELGYSVDRTNWQGQLDEYYRVHCETYERTGVTPHPKDYFRGIAEEMGQRGNAVLWTGVNPSGGSVAFHNDARLSNTSMYHTGCCESAHLDSGINYLLFWEALKGARSEGCLWYEIGEVFPSPQNDKERGLSVFKSKFGGDLHRSFKWTLDLSTEACEIHSESASVETKSLPVEAINSDTIKLSASRKRGLLERFTRTVKNIGRRQKP